MALDSLSSPAEKSLYSFKTTGILKAFLIGYTKNRPELVILLLLLHGLLLKLAQKSCLGENGFFFSFMSKQQKVEVAALE